MIGLEEFFLSDVCSYLVVIVNIGANMVCAGGVQVYPYLYISSN